MIIYEVDFEKYKKENELQNENPAEIIEFQKPEECFESYITKACDLFNNGYLLRSAHQFNKAYAIDAQKDHTNLVDVSILGIINAKLSNFELAQKYLLKSLSLTVVPTVVIVLYHNALYLKNFKLANRIKREFESAINFKDLCLVKNDTYLVYDENYNFNKLFNELITQMNIKKSSALIPLFDMLKVSDPTNPYLMQIEKDFVSNANRKYPFHFTPSLAKIRFNEIDMFLKSKNRDFNKIELNGIVRFLFENCKLERFNYYINEFLKMQNLPLNFIWQCEDALFNNFAEDKKISILEKLLFENRYCVKSIGLYLREQLFLFRGVEEFRELNSLNEKIAKSFYLAVKELINAKKIKQTNAFVVEIYMQRIIRRILINLKNGSLKTERISIDKLKRCFFILLANHMFNLGLDFKDEMKNLKPIFKKLGFDFDLMKSIVGKENVILVDFT